MLPTSLDSLREPGVGSRRGAPAWLSKRGAQTAFWILAGLFIIFSIYRLARFVPRPLDAPHTLRPVLNAWFDVFLRHYASPEAAYEDWRSWCLLALLIAPALAVVNLVREQGPPRWPERAARILCSRGLFFGSIAATLLLCRFPTLLDYQLNPDEGQFLAAAHKLFYDGNFFRSVDCGTSGPLNIYPLMLPAIVGFSPDYASSRVLVLLIALCVIYLFYRTVGLLAPESVARIAVLPLAGALAVFEDPNLVDYSSEQVPVLLVSLALFIAVRLLRDPAAYRVPLFLSGFLVSAAFLTKMQSVPIVGAIAAVALVYTYASGNARGYWRPAVLFVAGMLPLQLLNAALCLAAGVWTNFWFSYVVSNQRYSDVGSNFIAELPKLLTFFSDTPETGYFLVTFLALCASYALQRLLSDRAGEAAPLRRGLLPMALVSAVVIGTLMSKLLNADVLAIAGYVVLFSFFTLTMSFLLFYEKGSFGIDPVRWFGLLSLVATGAAVFSIYRPHRPFPHYLFFLFVPVAAVMAWMLMRQSVSSRAAFPLLVAALALTQTTFLWGSRDPHRFRTTVATIRQAEGDYIRSLTSPKGQIFVWGWTPDPYLGSGRVTATRDLNVFYQFASVLPVLTMTGLVPNHGAGPEEITTYYRRRLLYDLRRNPPELIVDAVGNNSWAVGDNATYGIEQVPEMARFVHDSYRHIADGYGERFYLRADLASRAALVKAPLTCAPAAIRCAASPRRFYPEGVTTPVMEDLPPVDVPEHALIEIQFTPFGRQTENATILNNEAAAGSFRGFRFQNVGGDLYQLSLGLGNRWASSRPFLLPDGKPESLSIRIAGTGVLVQANGAVEDIMHLPSAMVNGPGEITIGAGIDGANRFSGTIQFFQLVDLDKADSGKAP